MDQLMVCDHLQCLSDIKLDYLYLIGCLLREPVLYQIILVFLCKYDAAQSLIGQCTDASLELLLSYMGSNQQRDLVSAISFFDQRYVLNELIC